MGHGARGTGFFKTVSMTGMDEREGVAQNPYEKAEGHVPHLSRLTHLTQCLLSSCPLCSQVPALLDASMDLGGGKMNIHVLMALAAFASAFLGNALEGALLLAMFALSHVGEDPGPGYHIRGVPRCLGPDCLCSHMGWGMQRRSTLLRKPWEM